MSYEDRDTYGMYKRSSASGPGPSLFVARISQTARDDHVTRFQDDSLRRI